MTVHNHHNMTLSLTAEFLEKVWNHIYFLGTFVSRYIRDASGGRMSMLALLLDPAAEVMLLPVVCTLLGRTAGFVPGLCATCCTYLHKKRSLTWICVRELSVVFVFTVDKRDMCWMQISSVCIPLPFTHPVRCCKIRVVTCYLTPRNNEFWFRKLPILVDIQNWQTAMGCGQSKIGIIYPRKSKSKSGNKRSGKWYSLFVFMIYFI